MWFYNNIIIYFLDTGYFGDQVNIGMVVYKTLGQLLPRKFDIGDRYCVFSTHYCTLPLGQSWIHYISPFPLYFLCQLKLTPTDLNILDTYRFDGYLSVFKFSKYLPACLSCWPGCKENSWFFWSTSQDELKNGMYKVLRPKRRYIY